jgi:hypothetical protein
MVSSAVGPARLSWPGSALSVKTTRLEQPRDFQNSWAKAAAAAEVTAAVSNFPAGPLSDLKVLVGSHVVRTEAERVHSPLRWG